METILVERVTRKHVVSPVQEYLVRWKGLSKRKASWEREDALGKFADWNRWFKTAISTGSSMAWVGESVTNSLQTPIIIREGFLNGHKRTPQAHI